MISRTLAEAVLRDVIAACDPAVRVRDALGEPAIRARLAGRRLFAISIGKAALAMARGTGSVEAGLAVVPVHHATDAGPAHVAGESLRGGSRGDTAGADADGLPPGWQLLEASHPEPDVRSVAAGAAVLAFVQTLRDNDVLLALLSGGASALVEQPLIPLREFAATVRGVMAAGAAIDEINTVRGALSAIKAGQLALATAAPIVTLAVSDVIGDPLAVIGSGPTIGPWLASPGVAVDDGASARRQRARDILARYDIAVPAVLAADPPARSVVRADHAAVIAPMASGANAAVQSLAARGISASLVETPLAGDVDTVVRELRGHTGPIVAWGEPTLRVPDDHGSGGRAQQLALLLARHLRGSERCALVVGTDGVDGPPPPDRPAPAGAWIDGKTWEAIIAAGCDPSVALARCDAGTVLHAVGALVVTGPSGINHADLVVLG
jgi:glycerate-2-kinase